MEVFSTEFANSPLELFVLTTSGFQAQSSTEGAIGWDRNGPLMFGRLQLIQEMTVVGQRRWPLGMLNSGYVQRGLSRYTRAWGPTYRALSGEEQALTLREGRVDAVYDQAALVRGVPLPLGGDLIVARGGTALPAQVGDAVTINTRNSNPLGERPQVLGGRAPSPRKRQGGSEWTPGRL